MLTACATWIRRLRTKALGPHPAAVAARPAEEEDEEEEEVEEGTPPMPAEKSADGGFGFEKRRAEGSQTKQSRRQLTDEVGEGHWRRGHQRR